MLEVVWDTTKFNDKPMWADGAKQPFVLSTMDGLGLGQHADYVFGCEFPPSRLAGYLPAHTARLTTAQGRVTRSREPWMPRAAWVPVAERTSRPRPSTRPSSV